MATQILFRALATLRKSSSRASWFFRHFCVVRVSSCKHLCPTGAALYCQDQTSPSSARLAQNFSAAVWAFQYVSWKPLFGGLSASLFPPLLQWRTVRASPTICHLSLQDKIIFLFAKTTVDTVSLTGACQLPESLNVPFVFPLSQWFPWKAKK